MLVMTRLAPTVPAETDLLCEGCGYTLNGLPEDSRCPECGKPIEESIGHGRLAPPLERTAGPLRRLGSFFTTSASVLFRPTHFYRTLKTRDRVSAARRFAWIHWAITSLLFGLAAYVHASWYLRLGLGRAEGFGRWTLPLFAVVTFVAIAGTTLLAARLTTWEATYRGIRLPLPVVRRGLYYHAAHYLPVALVAVATVVGYQVLLARHVFDVTTASTYLYVLSGEVVLGALYLFHTYWIGMRNMMYANR
jgi:hypothetical protein